MWEKIPGVTKSEVARWREAAEAGMMNEAKAQRMAYGMDAPDDPDGDAEDDAAQS